MDRLAEDDGNIWDRESEGALPDGDYDTYERDAEERRSAKPDFSEIVYDEHTHQPHDPPPPNVSPLVRLLREHRLLIIAGTYAAKRGLARRCGWEMAQLAADEAEERTVAALELRTSNKAEDLLLSLDEEREPTVFVFPGIDPSKINRNLRALTGAENPKHWIVISTDLTREAWQLGEELEAIWVEPPEDQLYNLGGLKTYLIALLRDDGKARLATVEKRSGAEVPIEDLAGRLGSPQSIRSFVAELERLDAGAPPDLQDLVRRARSNRLAIQSWFRHGLAPRDQVIAIALSLFEGLEEDIAFSAIERLMDGGWRKRDTSIKFIDYTDLANLTHYFTIESGGGTRARMRALGDETRTVILSTAWQTHRRQIIAALPELVAVVIASTQSKGFDLRVLDRNRRQVYLRETIGRSLGEIALLSVEAVEPHLLALVASGRSGAHQTVASALRQMRMRGADDALFEMLTRWRTHDELRRYLGLLVADEKTRPISELIGSAVAASLGQLSLKDATNSIHEEILRLVKAYASSEDAAIVAHLADSALPTLILNHTSQMIQVLPDLFNRIGTDPGLGGRLAAGCGFGLGLAIRAGSAQAAETVRRWIDDGLKKSQKGFDQREVHLREKTLAAAARALGYVRRTSNTNQDENASLSLSLTTSMGILNRILAEERHPFVRENAIMAIHSLLRSEYEGVIDGISETIMQLADQERTDFTDRLTSLHCRQRSEQQGGDILVRFGGYWCPIWYDRAPENTAIQEQVFAWSHSDRSSVIAAFGADVVLAIREAIERSQEQKQQELVKFREEEKTRRKTLEETSAPRIKRDAGKLSWSQKRIVVPLATIGRRDLRHAVEGNLASLLQKAPGERSEVLERYRTEGDLKDLAAAAGRALWINHNLRPLGLALVVIVVLLYWVAR